MKQYLLEAMMRVVQAAIAFCNSDPAGDDLDELYADLERAVRKYEELL